MRCQTLSRRFWVRGLDSPSQSFGERVLEAFGEALDDAAFLGGALHGEAVTMRATMRRSSGLRYGCGCWVGVEVISDRAFVERWCPTGGNERLTKHRMEFTNVGMLESNHENGESCLIHEPGTESE